MGCCAAESRLSARQGAHEAEIRARDGTSTSDGAASVSRADTRASRHERTQDRIGFVVAVYEA